MTQYQRGYRFERKAMEELIKKGYFVIRSAGSHGIFDLIAIKHRDVRGVQCKLSGRISNDELAKMKEAGERYGILPMLAWKDEVGAGISMAVVK